MDLSERMDNVAVIGAAGKMGSGISLLLTHELALTRISPEGRGRTFRLVLVDVSEAALEGLLTYLRSQLLRLAEKSVGRLRALYAEREDLVENGDMIRAYLQDAFTFLRPATDLSALAGAKMVFEAVFEDEDLKVRLLSRAKEHAHPEAWFFTNTSSIPIGGLDEKLGLDGRILGYHFYNPPAVQKLLELIPSKRTRPDLKEAALTLAKRLGKKVIPANDVAGFIGNGHFIRDGLYAVSEAERLRAGGAWAPALYKMNRVSQDWLLRPMGIFQLIDYVGVDVFQCILRVMDRYLPGQGLHSDFIDALADRKVLGGQRHDGSQKDGILRYEKGKPAAVYDLEAGGYVSFAETGLAEKCDRELGPLPEGFKPWKAWLRDRDKEAGLAAYFQALRSMDTEGARLARAYLAASKAIAQKLLEDGVAAGAEDVNGVLVNGFYHLYGPINDYVD